MRRVITRRIPLNATAHWMGWADAGAAYACVGRDLMPSEERGANRRCAAHGVAYGQI